IFFLSAALLLACSTPEAPPSAPEGPTTYAPKDTADVHTVSPLAQLMRDMTAFADSTRIRLAKGEELPPYPPNFKDMLTLEPTPGMVDHRVYDPFAFAYLHQLDSLYHTAKADRPVIFDALVSACAACHGEVCPGPLTRINKLRPAKP
ncbi:MAG TPA: hypothetical protein VHL57_02730, partial [Flavobacteriales bacterium]|nr:hypothetical protein [Flavobacteriales bacterium]